MASKLRLVILGAPGSGKGTISSRLVKEFRLNHLATGDVIRANIQKKTELGLKVQELVKKGQLVPDEVVSKLVVSELNIINNSASGWLLDGYPRTIEQAKALDAKASLFALDKVVNLHVPFKEIINRLKHRWIHPASGRVYNLEFNPPKVAVIIRPSSVYFSRQRLISHFAFLRERTILPVTRWSSVRMTVRTLS